MFMVNVERGKREGAALAREAIKRTNEEFASHGLVADEPEEYERRSHE
jgi:hypothetical protein